MSDASAIQIEQLTHRYGQRLALDRVTFDVGRAEVFALLGPNGGGKSTLLKILCTLLHPSGGAARIAGQDVTADPAAVRRRIGVTFQSPSLDGKLTVRENLRIGGHLYGLHGGELRRRIDELLDRFDVADRANDYCSVLSGGLRRRVEIAKSMLHGPSVLLLDEPSTGLDPGARRELRGVFERLAAEGVTVFLTTHLMDEAEPCSRVAILDRGRLVALDTPAALRRGIGGDVVTFETDQPEELLRHIGDGAALVDGKVRVEHDAGHRFVAAVIDAFAGRISAAYVGQPTLDDVFIRRTGRRLENE